MREKIGLSIVERAIVVVPEFEKAAKKLEQQVILNSTVNNPRNILLGRTELLVKTHESPETGNNPIPWPRDYKLIQFTYKINLFHNYLFCNNLRLIFHCNHIYGWRKR